MMKTACLEFGSEGIRFNSLAPGPIDNRMMQSLHDQLNPDDPNSVREFVTESIPMRRYGSNQEIANLALFLASDESSFCNGAVFLSDGGFTAG
jgi:NAD(P)-dependent dehydrogenase (short-subunit alcohol dehydrogenase family)